MLQKVLLGLVALVLVLGVVVAVQPADYHVERSKTVAAPAEVTYALMSNFDRYNEWSPWAELDPNMKVTTTGKPGEAGYKYAWSGNDEVGSGEMTVAKAEANQRIDIDLHFITPFEATAKTSYILKADGAGTQVTWVMDGKNDFMGKAFGLFMDMQGMIEKDFDKGLAKLATVVEADAKHVAEAKAKAEAAAKAAAAALEAAKAATGEAGDPAAEPVAQ